MIDFYYYTSPNARKVLMMLEETGLEYSLRWLDITKGEQFSEDFKNINPNSKVPAIVDWQGLGSKPISLFESGAILLYLAEKSGRLLPSDPAKRLQVMSWTFWQVGNQGPMLGQAAHFVSHAASRGLQDRYAVDRYTNEARRLYAVMETRLSDREFLVDEYSIADIACFPWTRVFKGQGIDLDEFPNVRRWSDGLAARPSAKRRPESEDTQKAKGYQPYTDEQWKVLFGAAPAGICQLRNE